MVNRCAEQYKQHFPYSDLSTTITEIKPIFRMMRLHLNGDTLSQEVGSTNQIVTKCTTAGSLLC